MSIENPLVSIIIPVYNIEKYIERCVESILEQSYTNLQILLINDGSKDRSGAICEKLKKRDSRIEVYHKVNGGLSDARNYGILHANGKYLSFIDGDDWIEKEYIEKLLLCVLKYNADFSQCQFQYAFDDRIEKLDVKQEKIQVFSREQAIISFIESGPIGISVVAWGKLYKREIFSKIKYQKGMVHEDVFTTCDIIFEAINKVVIVDEPLYNYYQRIGSISNSNNVKRYCDRIIAQKHVLDRAEKEGKACYCIEAEYMLFDSIMNILVEIPNKLLSNVEFIRNIRTSCRKVKIKSLQKKNVKIRVLLYFIILKYCPEVYLYMWRLKNEKK